MFRRILVANRGEIAARIIRSCQILGIETIAVYSEPDSNLDYLKQANKIICIGEASATKSYLNQDILLRIAREQDCEAIHPGYGFLSENAIFSTRCEQQKLTFIGPKPEQIRMMGDKVMAIETMRKANVPCVPGSNSTLGDDPEENIRIAREIGFPVIIKAAGGGGGRGMRVVHTEATLLDSISLTKTEAGAAFNLLPA